MQEKNKSATNPINVWTVNPDISKSDDVAKSCPKVPNNKPIRRGQRVGLVSLPLGLISRLVACMQVNLAMLTVHLNYVKQRVDIFKLLSVSDG